MKKLIMHLRRALITGMSALFLMLLSTTLFAGNVTVNILAHDGTALPTTGTFKVFLGPNYVGEYNSGTSVSLTNGNTYKIFGIYNTTTTSRLDLKVNGDTTINWKTTLVTFHFSGGYLNYYGSGSWKSFSKPSMELFPKDYSGNTEHFQFGKVWNDTRYMYATIDYEGETSIEKTVAVLQLKDHNGNPLSGGTARGGYTAPTGWFVSGSTNSDGLLMDMRNGNPSNLTYEMKYNGTVNVQGPQDPSSNSYFDFQTGLVTLRMETCTHDPLDGGNARFGSGSTYSTAWFPGGATGSSASGETEAEFFGGTYSFDMQYKSTSDQKISVVIPSTGATLVWTTTKVTLHYSGDISMGGSVGDSRFFSKPSEELLPGTYTFHFRGGDYVKDLTFSGCNYEKTVAVLVLKDHNGNGLAGGTARGGNTTPVLWFVPGSTNANGILIDLASGNRSQLTYEMKVNGTVNVQGPQNTSTNSIFYFQTNLLTLRMETCDHDPLDGGHPRFGHGATYTTAWFAGGATGSSASGESEAEWFPGTYSFEMQYKATSDRKISVDIPDHDTMLVWTTTKVTLNYSGSISMGGSAGVSRWFSKPSEELLPGTYKFKFSGSGVVDLTFSGCEFNGGILKLVDENGDPLGGYPAEYPGETRNLKIKYRCGGSWGPETSVQTDANGLIVYNIGCSNWDNKITMTLNQTSMEQNVTSNATFQAARVDVNLKSCDGLISETPGGTVSQGGGYWYVHGTTGTSGTVTFYAFPGNVKVMMSYNHNSSTQTPVAISAGTNDIDFNATKVTFNMDIKSNKSGSWWTVSAPATLYLLPDDYSIWVKVGGSYEGPYTLTVSGCTMNPLLLRVVDEDGNGVEGGVATPACGGSWKPNVAGSTNSDGYLYADVPSCFTKIKMTVNQTSQEQTTSELSSSNYTYTTEILRVKLEEHVGGAITDETGKLEQGGGSWYNWGYYNASGYRDIPVFASNNVKFRTTYHSTSEEKTTTVSSGAGYQELVFQTGQVYGSCITEYASGSWLTFYDGIELMPGTYNFRYPSQSGIVTAGSVTNLACPGPNTENTTTGIDQTKGNQTNLRSYPNPFSVNTTIEYTLKSSGDVSVVIYDMNGKKVNELVNGNQTAGTHTINWNGTATNGSRMMNGVYLVRLVSGNQVQQIQVVIFQN